MTSYCASIKSRFLDRWEALIALPINEEQDCYLDDILSKLGDLAVKLWRLGRDINSFRLEHYGRKPYDHKSSNTEIVKVASKGASNRHFHGQSVVLVVQPRIVSKAMFGSQKARTLTTWASGVVWVSDKELLCYNKEEESTRRDSEEQYDHMNVNG